MVTKVREVVSKERVFGGKGDKLLCRLAKVKKEVADL